MEVLMLHRCIQRKGVATWKVLTAIALFLTGMAILLLLAPTAIYTYQYYQLSPDARAEYDLWIEPSRLYSVEELKAEPVSSETIDLFHATVSEYNKHAEKILLAKSGFGSDKESGYSFELSEEEIGDAVSGSEELIESLQTLVSQDDYESDLWYLMVETSPKGLIHFHDLNKYLYMQALYSLDHESHLDYAINRAELINNLSFYTPPSIFIQNSVVGFTDGLTLDLLNRLAEEDMSEEQEAEIAQILDAIERRYTSKYLDLPHIQLDHAGGVRMAFRLEPENAVLPKGTTGPETMRAITNLNLNKSGTKKTDQEDELSDSTKLSLFEISYRAMKGAKTELRNHLEEVNRLREKLEAN